MERESALITEYNLNEHPEGGWFSECYTSSDQVRGRALAGSIYFLLRHGEVSHFHQIDCDEVWYYHEGCGMRITVIKDSSWEEYQLGSNIKNGERAMVVIPKGSVFAAVNLEDTGYTFVSCMTTPKFTYEGFRLVYEKEIRVKYPHIPEELLYLAYKNED